MLPRIPLVEKVADFWNFSKAGRQLADLHLNYETVPTHPDVTIMGAEDGYFTVSKMKFIEKNRKDTIIYNSKITISGIPDKAYRYVVNGRSAIDWIIERYQVTTDNKSGITNDPNDWARELGNPRYILDLLLSIINLSVQTVDIVNGLPKLEFGESGSNDESISSTQVDETDDDSTLGGQ
jgi:predicted helicase